MTFSRSRSRSGYSSYGGFAPYVPVAKRRAQAAKAATKAAKDGKGWAPVVITGRKIASTFWGAAWCEHLESYSDYANRLPRGRTYVRNGSVVDLQIAPGVITARVQGSSLYTEKITVSPLAPARWAAIKAACAGKVTSLVGLLQGKLPDEVLRVVTDRASGLFPAPGEIKLSCSCPDSASLCKHLAAVLYGVGARLDERPELLFLLRGVNHQELVVEAIEAVSRGTAGAGVAGDALSDGDLADVFGIEIGGALPAVAPLAATSVPVIKRMATQIEKPKALPKAATKKRAAPMIAEVKRPRGRPAKQAVVGAAEGERKAVSVASVTADVDRLLGSARKPGAKAGGKVRAGKAKGKR